jgi:hypothetical protein
LSPNALSGAQAGLKEIYIPLFVSPSGLNFEIPESILTPVTPEIAGEEITLIERSQDWRRLKYFKKLAQFGLSITKYSGMNVI